MPFRRIAALALALSWGCASAPRSEPAVHATPSAGADGAILSLRPILVAGPSEYLALTYASSGLRVNGFLARPRDGAARHPAVIWNRGGNRDLAPLDPRWLVPYAEAGYVAVGSQYRGNMGGEGRETYPGDDHALSAHGRGVVDILAWLGPHLGVPPERHAPERLGPAVEAVLRAWPRSDGGGER